MMPEMSGREFIDRFSVARPQSCVLFMSGYTDDEVVRMGLLSGKNAFIEKPFTVEQITAKVRDVLASR
jgi:two-component system cell cycle sensor histidine kinase/response regulator CckA